MKKISKEKQAELKNLRNDLPNDSELHMLSRGRKVNVWKIIIKLLELILEELIGPEDE